MSTLVDRIVSGQFTLIAEIGVNYYDIAAQRGMDPLDAAKLMCDEAAAAGAHAVKFQSYKAGTLASKHSPSYWDTTEEPTTSQYELFSKFDHFGEGEYRALAEHCAHIGIAFLSTAFDFAAADYLEPLMDVYKVSSSDLTNLPFIRYQAAKGKPILMSLGAAELSEMQAAVSAVREVNDAPLVLLHCVLEYPTPYDHANLARIAALREAFPDAIIGYSDHCKPDASYDVIKAAYALGATVVEKHFTLDKTLTGNDHYHAMDPVDVRGIVQGIAFVEELMGSPELKYSQTEFFARLNARRSLVATRDIAAGTAIEESMLTFKRPGTGIAPSRIGEVVGRRAAVDIPEDTTITEDMLR